MKRVNFFKVSLITLLMLSTGISNAQDVTADFSWVSSSATNTSTGKITGCNGSVDVELITPSIAHQLNTNQAANIPAVSSNASSTLVTINFSPAVYDLSLLIADLDSHGSESATGFTPSFSTVTQFGTSTLFTANAANTAVTPNGPNNDGWIDWTGPVSSISFTYNRDPDFIMYLEEMTFNCSPTLTCLCSPKNEFNKLGQVLTNGQTFAEIQLNSGGLAISTLNISIPFWESLVDANCIDGCNLRALLNSGNILGSLPSVAGVTPTWAGAGMPSSEIVYHFATPTIIDEPITLNMQFPPTLPLSCCQNRVDYCVKVQMITKDCEVCETTLCLSDKPTGADSPTKKGNKTKVSPNIDGSGSQGAMILTPNPSEALVSIRLPHAEGKLSVYSLGGQLVLESLVSKPIMVIDVSILEPGSYVVRYYRDEEVITEKLIVN